MRRFNYTGRHGIPRHDVSIELTKTDDEVICFKAHVDLSRFIQKYPAAEIQVEAYIGNRTERFNLGTVERPRFSAEQVFKTFSAEESSDLIFRIKLVDVSEHCGRLVGIAKGIRPVSPDEVQHASLLPVVIDSLDNVVYEVQYQGDLPVLVLNSELDDDLEQGMKTIARGVFFQTLVFPSAVKEVLTRILVIDKMTPDLEDDGHWVNRWIRFAESRNPEPRPQEADGGDSELILQWIDGVVQKFGEEVNCVRKFHSAMVDK